MRRRGLLLGGVVVGLLTCMAVLALWNLVSTDAAKLGKPPKAVKPNPTPWINQDGFALIQPGMSEEEVHRVFGVPPGVYVSQTTHDLLVLSSHLTTMPQQAKGWMGDQLGVCEFIWVAFSEQGKVISKGYEKPLGSIRSN